MLEKKPKKPKQSSPEKIRHIAKKRTELGQFLVQAK